MELDGRETGTLSTRFKLRRVDDVLLIESLSDGLNNSEALGSVWQEARGKKSRGIILHLPTPKYVSSLFIRQILRCSQDAAAARTPFTVVVHPKLRLLFQMFEMLDEMPTAERLDRALLDIDEQAKRYAATEK